MKSNLVGNPISQVEVTNISSHGIWLFAHGEEMFLSYKDFPWFKNVIVEKIINVVEPFNGHFHWPDIDVDLSAEIIKHPERFPFHQEVNLYF